METIKELYDYVFDLDQEELAREYTPCGGETEVKMEGNCGVHTIEGTGKLLSVTSTGVQEGEGFKYKVYYPNTTFVPDQFRDYVEAIFGQENVGDRIVLKVFQFNYQDRDSTCFCRVLEGLRVDNSETERVYIKYYLPLRVTARK